MSPRRRAADPREGPRDADPLPSGGLAPAGEPSQEWARLRDPAGGTGPAGARQPGSEAVAEWARRAGTSSSSMPSIAPLAYGKLEVARRLGDVVHIPRIG